MALATLDWPPLYLFIYNFFFLNLGWGHFGKKNVIIVELQKFGSLEGCIAKIEILEVELKIAPKFEG